jgi:hypothetical protein
MLQSCGAALSLLTHWLQSSDKSKSRATPKVGRTKLTEGAFLARNDIFKSFTLYHQPDAALITDSVPERTRRRIAASLALFSCSSNLNSLELNETTAVSRRMKDSLLTFFGSVIILT